MASTSWLTKRLTSLRTWRRSLLVLHLFAAMGIFGHVYGTVSQPMAQLVFVPLLALSGIAMWQLARIRRLWHRGGPPIGLRQGTTVVDGDISKRRPTDIARGPGGGPPDFDHHARQRRSV